MGTALRSRPARQAAALLIIPLAAVPLVLLPGIAGAQAGGAVKGTIDNKFDPATLEVKVGTKVTWTLDGAHSVTGGKDGTPDESSPMKSELAVPTYEVTFDKEGTFPYFCIPHFSLGMTGEIVVSQDGPAAEPTGGATPSASAAAPAATSTPAPKDPNLGKAAFDELDEKKAAPADTMTKFRMLLWGLTAATLVLSAGVFASTRPRRNT